MRFTIVWLNQVGARFVQVLISPSRADALIPVW